jgi:hypothetical protein
MRTVSSAQPVEQVNAAQEQQPDRRAADAGLLGDSVIPLAEPARRPGTGILRGYAGKTRGPPGKFLLQIAPF